MNKPNDMTQEQFDAWPNCSRPGCEYKVCTWGSDLFCYKDEEDIVGKPEMDRRYDLTHAKDANGERPMILVYSDIKTLRPEPFTNGLLNQAVERVIRTQKSGPLKANLMPPVKQARRDQALILMRLNSPLKLSPAEFFITVGPGEIEDNYYGVIMTPDPTSEHKYVVIAKCKYGFEDPQSAKMDAAKHFPSVPVLVTEDQYAYPYYDVRKMQILVETQQKRKAKADKLAQNIAKSKSNSYHKH